MSILTASLCLSPYFLSRRSHGNQPILLFAYIIISCLLNWTIIKPNSLFTSLWNQWNGLYITSHAKKFQSNREKVACFSTTSVNKTLIGFLDQCIWFSCYTFCNFLSSELFQWGNFYFTVDDTRQGYRVSCISISVIT